MKYKTICAAFAAILALIVATPKAEAVSVLWDVAPTTISGDSDISTVGTGVVGVTFSAVGGGPAAPYTGPNGVPFKVFYATADSVTNPPSQVNGVTIAATGTYLYGKMSNPVNPNAPNPPPPLPYFNLSASYKDLIRHYNWSSNTGSLNMTLTGLTANQNYLLQVWYADPAVTDGGRQPGQFSINGTTSAFVDPNVTNSNAGVGQFINAFVTLGAGETSFTLSAINGGGISAFQLRAVPEPSTVGALAFGGVIFFGLIYYRRRRAIAA